MSLKRLPAAVVCLAAGNSQVIIIQKAKMLGLSVIAVDRNSTAPGFAFSDEHIVMSTYEAEPIIERLKEFNDKYNLVGVINRSSGPPVITCAKICKAFDLPGVPVETAQLIIDKSKLMHECALKGIPAPQCQSASTFNDLNFSDIYFPCVVKPALSLVGKSGVMIATDNNTLADAFAFAQEASFNGIVNIEEYILGRDICLMSVVKDGSLYPITLIDELNFTNRNEILYGTGVAVPSIFSGKDEEERIITLAKKIVHEFEINTSPFMMSCRCEKNDYPKLIEIHLDMGGDSILDSLIPNSTSVDILGLIINMLINNKRVSINRNFKSVAVLKKGECIITAENRLELEKIILKNLNKFN